MGGTLHLMDPVEVVHCQRKMSVRTNISEHDGIFFITITCFRWVNLFKITNGFHIVYKWFDHLKDQGHYICGYVILPNHLHALLAFRRTEKTINRIIGNGKRLIAYQLVSQLNQDGRKELLNLMMAGVNKTDKSRGKLHQVFQPSFD